MGDISKERLPRIIRPGIVIMIVKKPACSGIRREALVWKESVPPRHVLSRLDFCRKQSINIVLCDCALIDPSIAFILHAPAKVVYYTGKSVCTIPLAQFDPSIRPIREKILVGVKGQVLLIEIGFEMEHVAHADKAGIVWPGKVAGIVREGRS